MRQMLSSVSSYLEYFTHTNIQKAQAKRILKAMQSIDRKFFLKQKTFAYADHAFRIEEGQTISQPSTIARMLLLSDLKKKHDVLEVGSGSGYNAALVANLVKPGSVLSIDRYESLVKRSQENVLATRKKLNNLSFKHANLYTFNPIRRFDRVIITAGISPKDEDRIYSIANKILKEKGKLICPHESGPIIILTKTRGKIIEDFTDEEYTFVPLADA